MKRRLWKKRLRDLYRSRKLDDGAWLPRGTWAQNDRLYHEQRPHRNRRRFRG